MKFQEESKLWSIVRDLAKHQDILTDWLLVGMWPWPDPNCCLSLCLHMYCVYNRFWPCVIWCHVFCVTHTHVYQTMQHNVSEDCNVHTHNFCNIHNRFQWARYWIGWWWSCVDCTDSCGFKTQVHLWEESLVSGEWNQHVVVAVSWNYQLRMCHMAV
jgi:hypothetical protein